MFPKKKQDIIMKLKLQLNLKNIYRTFRHLIL